MIDTKTRIVNLRLVMKLYDELIKKVSRKYELSPIETNIISFLHNNPELDTASDISAYRNFPKSNVSQGVCGLCQRGFLRCVPYEEDKRKMHLYLTRKAMPVMSDIDETVKEMNGILFEGFTEEERSLYAAFQQRAVKNAKNHLEKI